MKNVALILLAGGTGSRFGGHQPKQFYTLNNKPLVHYSLEVFLQCEHIAQVIVVADPLYHHFFQKYPVTFAQTGSLRQDSFENGLHQVFDDIPWVCVHDAARPLVTLSKVNELIAEGKTHGAATLATPVTSTIKEVKESSFVSKTLKRECLWDVQTPQMASKQAFKKGLALAKEKNLIVTDDVSLIELQGLPVKIVKSNLFNIKMTYPEDLNLIQYYLERHHGSL